LIEIKVLLDLWPYETSWEVVRDVDGSVVLQGDALYNRYAALCFPSSDCYTFTIYDVEADVAHMEMVSTQSSLTAI